jgi:hypothetical protein
MVSRSPASLWDQHSSSCDIEEIGVGSAGYRQEVLEVPAVALQSGCVGEVPPCWDPGRNKSSKASKFRWMSWGASGGGEAGSQKGCGSHRW